MPYEVGNMLASNSTSSFSFLILSLIFSPMPLTDITHTCAAASLPKQRAFLTPDCLLQSRWQCCCIMTDDASNCTVLMPLVKALSVYAFVHILVSAPYTNTDIMKVSNTHIFNFLDMSHFQSLSNCYSFLAFFIISIIFFCTVHFRLSPLYTLRAWNVALSIFHDDYIIIFMSPALWLFVNRRVALTGYN